MRICNLAKTWILEICMCVRVCFLACARHMYVIACVLCYHITKLLKHELCFFPNKGFVVYKFFNSDQTPDACFLTNFNTSDKQRLKDTDTDSQVTPEPRYALLKWFYCLFSAFCGKEIRLEMVCWFVSLLTQDPLSFSLFLADLLITL